MYYFVILIVTLLLLLSPGFVISMGYINPSAKRNLKKIQAGSARAERLIRRFEEDLPRDSIVLLDGDNIRGKTSFSVSKEQLLHDMRHLESRIKLPLHLYYDHGRSREAYVVRNTTVVFSGEKTADDIITSDVSWWINRFKPHLIVITADSGLKARCHRAAKADKNAITIIDSNLFLEMMDALTTREGIKFPVAPTDASTTAPLSISLKQRDLLRLELRLRDQVRSLQRLSTVRSGGRKKRAQFNRRLGEIENRLRDCISRQEQDGCPSPDGAPGGGGVGEDRGKLARIECLDEGVLADVLREQSQSGDMRREETWERCILAERLRKKLLRAAYVPITDSSGEGGDGTGADSLFGDVRVGKSSTTYVQEFNKNFSQTDFLTLEAMSQQQREEYFTSELPPHGDFHGDNPGITNPGGAGDLRREGLVAPVPSRSLNLKPFSVMELRAQRSLAEKSPEPFASGLRSRGGELYSQDDIGCRVFNLSLSCGTAPAIIGPTQAAPIFKVVCVSDTHAMERALNGKVPHGDVLVHAGDYAGGRGSGSRGNKHAKSKSRGLDTWLSTLPHAVKIVVRGNHDCLMPHFEQSGALHFHRSDDLCLEKQGDGSLVVVSGERGEESRTRPRLHIGLSPYGSRRVPHRCDLLVSHSPPRGVLDATLSKKKDAQGLPLPGKPAGSQELLDDAISKWRHAEPRSKQGSTNATKSHAGGEAEEPALKPIVWVCGHIHEGHGAQRFLGEQEGRDSVLCLNVANANPGCAASLHHLPTVINIYE